MAVKGERLRIGEVQKLLEERGYPMSKARIYKYANEGRLKKAGGKGGVGFWERDVEAFIAEKDEMERLENEMWSIEDLARFFGYTVDHTYVTVREKDIPHIKLPNSRILFDPEKVVEHVRQFEHDEHKGRPRSGEPSKLLAAL